MLSVHCPTIGLRSIVKDLKRHIKIHVNTRERLYYSAESHFEYKLLKIELIAFYLVSLISTINIINYPLSIFDVRSVIPFVRVVALFIARYFLFWFVSI